jgi:hypothetical protein
MFIARGTVKIHLEHIFAKLGYSTRAELAAEAVRKGISGPPRAAKTSLADALASIDGDATVENGVVHARFWNDELSHFTGTFVGSFVADQVDPRFRLNGTAADGSKVVLGTVHHFTAESIALGENHDLMLDGVRSELFRPRCK